ncbi:hypothetical protein KQX54_008210 [Cotesia glomerata]|uniref:Uncharacterized protein n=1 Tax=Cotesia glomerata TaxID=32391 RepID=A0AAV7I6M9_COTGL|nr:hypothetical protein KQX54_008210 [Cotesia glomerata]
MLAAVCQGDARVLVNIRSRKHCGEVSGCGCSQRGFQNSTVFDQPEYARRKLWPPIYTYTLSVLLTSGSLDSGLQSLVSQSRVKFVDCNLLAA